MTDMQLKYLAHQETVQHNRATENLGARQADEQARSNLARETETWRHNKMVENETIRANKQHETETQRHNKVSEVMQGGDTVSKNLTAIAKIVDLFL